MKNSDYWKLRFEQLEKAQNKLAEMSRAEIETLYRQAVKEIEWKINTWYQRLAANNGVSMAEARKLLNASELAEFKWDVHDYIKYGQDNALSGQWIKQLENASAKFHISKYEALKIQTQQSLEALFAKQAGITSDTMKEVYQSGYYHTAFEIQKGFGVGWDISGVDQGQIEKVISKPWAADKYNFSERIWNNKQKLISEVHNELTQSIITGADPQKAINNIAKKMNVSKSNAGRLVMTESAYFSSAAQKDCFEDFGVEEYEIVATLDSHTSEICQNMDGKHFPMKDFQAGVTAPPFHPWCRSTTCPWFEEDYGEVGERAARDEETGKTYYVPADLTYKEWKKGFVDGDKSDFGGVDKTVKSGIIKLESDNVALENQRYGRNKSTLVNKTYINSGEYRNKFDRITDNKDVSRILYAKSKEMLKHRSGTMYEDMYWIDAKTGDIIASALNEKSKSSVTYSETIKKLILGKTNLIAMHTHPHSFPPSAADFNSAFLHGYEKSIVLCHDGKVFQYISYEIINKDLYNMYIQKFLKQGISEFQAQLEALNKIKENYSIDFWEVK